MGPKSLSTYAAYHVVLGTNDPSGTTVCSNSSPTAGEIANAIVKKINELRGHIDNWENIDACGRLLTVELNNYKRNPNFTNCMLLGTMVAQCVAGADMGGNATLAGIILALNKICADKHAEAAECECPEGEVYYEDYDY